MFFARSVSMGKVAHFVAWPREELIVFRAAFFGARFASVRAHRQKVQRDGDKQLREEIRLFSRFSLTGVNGVRKVMEAIEGAFK